MAWGFGFRRSWQLILCALVMALLASCGGGSDDEAAPQSKAQRLSASETDTQAQAAAVSAPVLSAAWTQIPNPNGTQPVGPSGRAWTEMAWDATRQTMFFWGGNSAGGYNGYLDDLWTLNPASATWTVLDPDVICPGNDSFRKPNGSDDTAVGYDPVNDLYWIFGVTSGYRCKNIMPVHTAAAGTTTSSIVDTTLSTTDANAYRYFTVLVGSSSAQVSAYDPGTQTLTLSTPITGLAAGTSYQLYATTGGGVWYWDPKLKTWTGQDTPVGNTGLTPTPARRSAAVAYSDTDRAFVLYGGVEQEPVDQRVWKLDVTTKQWTALAQPLVTPPKLRQLLNSFVYDKRNNVFILFGGMCIGGDGQCASGALSGQTWAYYLATNTWVNMSPPYAPSARAKQLMAYDDDNGVVTLFGGSDVNGAPLNDTWYYDFRSNTWTQVTPSASPAGRYLGLVSYDPVNKNTVVFAGSNGNGILGDVWALKLAPSSDLPTVSMGSPADGNSLVASGAIALAANASASSGSIVKIEYFAGSVKIGESANAPFSSSWTGASAGLYLLSARATDSLGRSNWSAPVMVTVNGSSTQPPSVSLSAPTSGASYVEPAGIGLTATASDSNGTITQVDFYAGTAKIGSATASPYTMNWSNVAAGTYSLRAVATDSQGAMTISAPVTVTVSAAGATPINVALQTNGGVASASSTYSSSFPVSAINDGVLNGANWGKGGGWNDGTSGSYPDWAQVSFAGVQSINRVDVYTLADYAATTPVSTTTFTQSGITDFQIQTWDGSAWVTVPGGDIHGNRLVWRSVSFPTVSTDRVRVLVSGALGGYSRIIEVQAWALSFNSGGSSNQVPSVSLTAPTAGSSYAAPASITLTANASDSDGSITQVDFYQGSTKIGTATSAPYTMNWSNVAAGTYSLTARATDDQGAVSTSAAVTVTVNTPGNQAPTVSLSSPASGSSYTSPASIPLAASASDADGSIAKVEFYTGATKLATVTSAPYSFSWTNVAAGSYSITAVATDNAGASTTSAAVTVTVTDVVQVPQPINAALQANGGVATASSSFSSSYPVSAINDGIVTAARWGSTGSGGGWNDGTSNSFPDWAQVSFSGVQTINRVDVYTLPDYYASTTPPTATATFTQYGITDFQIQYWSGSAWIAVPGGDIHGNNLVWRSVSFPAVSTSAIRVLVSAGLGGYSRIVELQAWTSTAGANGNQLPTVSLSAPATGSSYTAPASITVSANASDSDGSVAQVDFYAGGTKIGTATSAPYTISWTNVAAGTYSLTAVATDDQGGTNTSSAVTVIVNAPANQAPSVSLSAPTGGSSYTAPAAVTLTASASDADGSIAKVDFYQGSTKIGTATSAPYTMSWTNVAAGSYSLTAVATDNLGATSTSAAVGITVSPGASTTPINAALQSNGGVASASSTFSSSYPVSSINDGVVTAARWGNTGSGGGWNDGTSAAYPDWVQINFAGTQSINRIDVYTLPDYYASTTPPTATATFTQYGITDFQIQYWSGTDWVTVAGGDIHGNNLVWRSVSFPAVSTSSIRVLVSGALGGYSRIAEVQAWTSGSDPGTPVNQAPSVSLAATSGSTYTAPASIALTATASDTDGSVAQVDFYLGATKIGTATSAPFTMNWTNVAAGTYSLTAVATDNQGATATSPAISVTVNPAPGSVPVNMALQSNGGVASASSTYASIFPVSSINDGVVTATNWANGGGWNDSTSSTYPDWVQINFASAQAINRVDVYTLADNYATAGAPSATTTFTQYGITDFQVQYWDGSNWVTVPGGTIQGNRLVWNSISFATISTSSIRILVTGALQGYSRITEVQAWTAAGS